MTGKLHGLDKTAVVAILGLMTEDRKRQLKLFDDIRLIEYGAMYGARI